MHAPGIVRQIFSPCKMLGPGEVEWACLNSVCPSELLKFEETAAAALESAQLDEVPKRRSHHGDRSQSPVLSPRGTQRHCYGLKGFVYCLRREQVIVVQRPSMPELEITHLDHDSKMDCRNLLWTSCSQCTGFKPQMCHLVQ